jgi:hypothetical protein
MAVPDNVVSVFALDLLDGYARAHPLDVAPEPMSEL